MSDKFLIVIISNIYDITILRGLRFGSLDYYALLYKMKYLDYVDYDIHPDGTVVSYKRKTPRALKQNLNCKYLSVELYKNGIRLSILVHRLVAECFIPNPHNLPQVNHKDGDKFNNRSSNLEWCTAKENITHGISVGLINLKGESHHNHKLIESEILDIRRKYATGNYEQQLAKEYGVSISTLSYIVNRKTWKHI